MSTDIKETVTDRGFERIDFNDHNGIGCSLQQSSALDPHAPGSLDHPGSSLLWLGCNDADPRCFVPNGDPAWRRVEMPDRYIANTRMHLNRAQVQMLIGYLQSWLDSGSFNTAQERPNA